MKSNYLYLLFICVISCLFVSCSDEDNKGENIPEWNRFRTTNVLVYAHLSEQNLFSSCSYKEVASSIRNTVHSVALLDRTNAVYGQTAIINTGTETARESKKVPVFVPVSYSDGEKKIIGSTVLFPSTISEMTQYVVKNDCRYLETKTEAVNGIDMLFCSVSLNSEDLIAPAVDVFKKKVNEQTVLVGTVKRALLPNLESAITSNLTSDTYSFVEVENRNRDSEYCIFVLTSHKWAFRGVTETSVSGDLHCFQLQIESLK